MRFDSLPLSQRTLQGLSLAKLEIATEIQAAAIPHALAGRDILGAAKTGSGKTLSFIVPILEKLYRERWTHEDGLGAIVISPTRELALQIFEVLRTVGRKHQFSAGLVTGGKKEFDGEQERVVRMNILVSTPGRLLQHMEQTPGFDASRVLVLVLDEADRILDLGFRQQLDSILEYLPVERQTLLFSATQTKSVKDLARLSLKKPEFLAVHADHEEVTPKQLVQNYVVCQLPEKLDILFSFIKSHLKSKIIVFFSTCAQVRFVYECFCGMQPGVPLTALHGKVKQERRTIIYMDFLKRPAACLFATDIAARGLDFPNVDWVIQVDAPEDAAMYIHRVGRTARYTSSGRALLLLMPQEEKPVVGALETAGVPIKKLTVNPNRKFSVSSQAAALLAAQPDFRLFAKKAFSSYLRSIQMLPQYPCTDITQLPVNEFATALGLPFTPELPIIVQETAVRDEIREKKNVNRALDKLKKQIKEAKELKKKAKEEAKRTGRPLADVLAEMQEAGESDDEEDSEGKNAKRAKKMSEIAREISEKRAQQKELKGGDGNESDEDFLTVKQVHHWNDVDANNSGIVAGEDVEESALPAPKKKEMVVKIKKDGSIKVKNAPAPKKTVFDDEGNIQDDRLVLREEDALDDQDLVKQRIEQYAKQVKSQVDEGRQADDLRDKERLREAKLKRKLAEREASRKDEMDGGDGPVAVLAGAVEEESDEDDDEDEEDDDSDDDNSSGDSEDDDNDVQSGDPGDDYSIDYEPNNRSSDEDDDEGEGLYREEEDEEESEDSDDDSDDTEDEKHRRARFAIPSNNKRKRNVDDSSDEDSDDSGDNRRGVVDKAALADQERLALELLSGKRSSVSAPQGKKARR